MKKDFNNGMKMKERVRLQLGVCDDEWMMAWWQDWLWQFVCVYFSIWCVEQGAFVFNQTKQYSQPNQTI